jgi:type IV pilus assembly protein PilO
MANIDLKSPALQKIILSVILAGGVVGVFFFTHFLPFSYPAQSEHINALKADYEKKSTELARARATVADLPRFEAEYDQMHERWAMAAELLPADRELATLLRKVTLAAQETGVQFQIFRPSGNKSEQYYTEVPMQITVNGGYHQVGAFMAELANMRRIITVANVHLHTFAASKSQDDFTTTAQFTASAYSLNNTPAPVAPATAAAKKEGAQNAHKAS